MSDQIDHHKRARRIKAIIDERTPRDWSIGGAEEGAYLEHSYENYSLDGEIPCVPFRYVVQQWNDDGRTLAPIESYEENGVLLVDDEDGMPEMLYDLDEGRVYTITTVHQVQPEGKQMWQEIRDEHEDAVKAAGGEIRPWTEH